MKNVYVIVQSNDKTYWKPCGVAFENRDGSLNMKLDLFPNLTFNIKERIDATDFDPEELEAQNGNQHPNSRKGSGENGERRTRSASRSARD